MARVATMFQEQRAAGEPVRVRVQLVHRTSCEMCGKPDQPCVMEPGWPDCCHTCEDCEKAFQARKAAEAAEEIEERKAEARAAFTRYW